MTKEDIISRDLVSRCLHPIKLKVSTFLDGVKVDEYPCGKCYHCRLSRVNEWSTRLQLHAQYYNYIYFITLTYDRIRDKSIEAETLAYKHNINSTHKYALQPIVLVKSHLQKFFKRLRARGFRFTYYAVGEYGHKYSRPHYHIIMYANQPIDYKSICYSWRLNDKIIGHVDMQDLMQNGTFSKVGKFGKNAFQYVTKYLFKEYNIKQHKHYNYIKNVYETQYEFDKANNLVDVSTTKDDYSKQKCKSILPFSLCSKRPFIGADYYQANKVRFVQQDFRIFGLQDTSISFPKIYLRKVKEIYFPYRFEDITKSGAMSRCQNSMLYTLSSLHKVCNSKTYLSLNNKNYGEFAYITESLVQEFDIYAQYLNFIDIQYKYRYIYHKGRYIVQDTKGNFINFVSLGDVYNQLQADCNRYIDFLKRLKDKSTIKKQKHIAEIISVFGNYDTYIHDIYKAEDTQQNNLKLKQYQYEQTKTLF